MARETVLRIARYEVSGEARCGVVDGTCVRGLRGDPYSLLSGTGGRFQYDDETRDLGEVRLLAPCLPSKIVCLGLNYRSHAEETGLPIPTQPLIFLKAPTAVVGPEDEIVLPPLSPRRVDYEAELGVVIGKRAKDVHPDRARDHVLGYTCFNDVSERHAQSEDGQWTRAKSYDTFAPIGPWIETDVATDDVRVETRLNGELRQSASTGDLIFGISDLISFVSAVMTLLPGDVIATGTPSGIGRMNPGDVVEISVEGIGTLRNRVVESRETVNSLQEGGA